MEQRAKCNTLIIQFMFASCCCMNTSTIRIIDWRLCVLNLFSQIIISRIIIKKRETKSSTKSVNGIAIIRTKNAHGSIQQPASVKKTHTQKLDNRIQKKIIFYWILNEMAKKRAIKMNDPNLRKIKHWDTKAIPREVLNLKCTKKNRTHFKVIQNKQLKNRASKLFTLCLFFVW